MASRADQPLSCSVLARFIEKFLLECNTTAVRWQAHSLIGRTQLTHIVAARDLCVTAVSTEIINEEIHLSRYS